MNEAEDLIQSELRLPGARELYPVSFDRKLHGVPVFKKVNTPVIDLISRAAGSGKRKLFIGHRQVDEIFEVSEEREETLVNLGNKFHLTVVGVEESEGEKRIKVGRFRFNGLSIFEEDFEKFEFMIWSPMHLLTQAPDREEIKDYLNKLHDSGWHVMEPPASMDRAKPVIAVVQTPRLKVPETQQTFFPQGIYHGWSNRVV